MKKQDQEKSKKTAQEIQDEIFRKMSAEKKLKLTFELSSFCLKLNSLNEKNKSRGNTN